MPDWWTWQRPQFVNRVGDPATKDGAADLMRRSPIARVDAISKPLLVTNGANDPRVFPDQSEEIVDALKARGKPVTYAFYPDEGHVYAKDATRSEEHTSELKSLKRITYAVARSKTNK